MKHTNDDRDLLDDDDPLKGQKVGRAVRHGPRRWPWLLLGLFLFLTVIAGLVPRLASMAPVRRLVLAKVNVQLAPAILSVDDWSFRWFGPQSVSGLRFADAANGAELRVVKVTTSGGLAGMLPIGKLNLGTITVDAPQVVARLPPKTTKAPEETEKPRETEASAAPKKATGLPVSDLAVKLVVEGGRIEVAGAGAKPFLLEHVGMTAEIKSVRDPVILAAATFVPWGDDAGRIALDGTLPSPEFLMTGGAATPEHLTLGVTGLDLQGFRGLLEALTGQPWIRSGVADGKIALSYCGKEQVQVQADLAVVKLSVEQPGKPVSPAGDVRVQTDLSYADGRLTVGKFACSSPWVGMRANGQFAVQPDANGRRTGGLEAQVDADVVAITRDFSGLLNLSDGFRVERGAVHLEAVLAGTAEALDAKISLATTNLALRSGQDLFLLQPAPAMKLNVSVPYGQPPEVRELLVELPFARIGGKGRMDQATLKANFDLTGFSKQFRRVLAGLPAMEGSIDLDAKTRTEGDKMAADVLVTASGVTVDLGPGRRLELNHGRLTFAAKATQVNGVPAAEASDVAFAFESDAGSISGSANRMVPPLSNRPPVVVGGQVKVDLDLESARRFAAPFLDGILPAKSVLKGKVVANVTAEAAGGQAKVRVNTAAQDLQLTTSAWDVRENDVRIKISADTDTARGLTKIFDTHVTSGLATLDVPEWQVQTPRAGEALAMRGSANGEVNLATLAAWQRPGKDGKPPPQIRGKLTFQAQGGTDPQGVVMALNAALDQFVIATGTNRPFSEPHAEVALKVSLPTDASRLTLENLSLKASLASLDAKGKIDDLQKQCLVDIGGTLAVDFDTVNKLLRAQGVPYPVVSGKQMKPFAVSGPMGGGAQAILSYGKASAALYLGSAAAFGLTSGPADVAVSLAGGVARVAYEPALNQGRLRLVPNIEVTCSPMVLSLPPKTSVLKDVQLTQEMLDQVLVMIVPLLRGSSVTGGTVDLAMQDCHVPLGPTLATDMTFTAALTLHNLQLAPNGTLATLLQLAGMGGQPVSVKEYAMTAECKNGRVRPSPLVIGVGGTKVKMTGTVGLDQTLAFTVEVPLSKTLVGSAAAKYLDGTVLNVPVTGTVKAPAIDRGALDAEVRRLIVEAGKKAAMDAGKKAGMDALGGFLNSLNKH